MKFIGKIIVDSLVKQFFIELREINLVEDLFVNLKKKCMKATF